MTAELRAKRHGQGLFGRSFLFAAMLSALVGSARADSEIPGVTTVPWPVEIPGAINRGGTSSYTPDTMNEASPATNAALADGPGGAIYPPFAHGAKAFHPSVAHVLPQREPSHDLTDWVATALTFGAVALATAIAVGVRQSRRS